MSCRVVVTKQVKLKFNELDDSRGKKAGVEKCPYVRWKKTCNEVCLLLAMAALLRPPAIVEDET